MVDFVATGAGCGQEQPTPAVLAFTGSSGTHSIVGPLVVDTLLSGRDVVLDFPANTKAVRAWHRSLFEEAAAEHVLHFIVSPDATCLERIEHRNVSVPERHLTPELFEYVTSFFQPPEAEEGFVVRHYAP
jgi:hypothetical protein